jgi:F420H(2)-dependent quinone reductase
VASSPYGLASQVEAARCRKLGSYSPVSFATTLQHSFLRLHQRIYEGTDGTIGHRMLGVPSLLLRTTGRRSGAQRTNALIYAMDGPDYVLVASNGGAQSSPAWFFNARAKPEVAIQVARRKMSGTARIVERADGDYERLWKLVNDNNHGRYDAYQAMTSRQIPLVVVSPS